MSSRNPPVKYTPAELRSFELVPPTCDAIDAATDKLARYFDEEVILSALHGNRVDVTPQVVAAMREAIGRHVWQAVHRLSDVAKYQGTYPLRLALVREIESQFDEPQPVSNYERWLADRAAIAAARALQSS